MSKTDNPADAKGSAHDGAAAAPRDRQTAGGQTTKPTGASGEGAGETKEASSRPNAGATRITLKSLGQSIVKVLAWQRRATGGSG